MQQSPAAHSFTIPAPTHDIPSRLFISQDTPQFQPASSHKPSRQTLAILAHPYAPLGGSYDDPVVKLLTTSLLSQGISVLTFNFNAGSGRASWRAATESGEYAWIVAFAQEYLIALNPVANCRIIVGGYSFGSLVAAQVDLEICTASDMADHCERISKAAEEVVRLTGQTAVGSSIEATETASSKPSRSAFEYAFLLVSPPRPPISWVLLPFRSSASSSRERANLTKHPLLVVSGTADEFTAITKVEAYCQSISTESSGYEEPIRRVRFVAISGAGHFYREDGAAEQLREAVCDWAAAMPA